MTNRGSGGGTNRAERAVFGSWLATGLGVLSVLVPKCPLCAAAYLCLFGVSAGSARAIVQLGVPLCVGLILLSALGTALLVASRGRRLAARSSAGVAVPACACRTSRSTPVSNGI